MKHDLLEFIIRKTAKKHVLGVLRVIEFRQHWNFS